jgi:hypothetical protein
LREVRKKQGQKAGSKIAEDIHACLLFAIQSWKAIWFFPLWTSAASPRKAAAKTMIDTFESSKNDNLQPVGGDRMLRLFTTSESEKYAKPLLRL